MTKVRIDLFGVLALVAGCACAQEPASAPSYWLKQGVGYPVCRDFLDNLNAFPPEEPPMVCEQKIHPTHSEFGRPAWEEMDIDTNLELIRDAERLLLRFNPTRSVGPDFADWERNFRERISSGRANPRLRRAPFQVGENPEETLILYEPVADECAIGLAKDGVGGGPGGYLFVLSTATQKLDAFVGSIGTHQRTDVLIYRGEYPYVTTSTPDGEVIGERRVVNGVLANDYRQIYRLGLHPISASRVYEGRFHVSERCMIGTDRKRPQ